LPQKSWVALNALFCSLITPHVADNSTSCEAAVLVQPKARLCEPWVTSLEFVGAAERRPNQDQIFDFADYN
jgi:hypothetical protein